MISDYMSIPSECNTLDVIREIYESDCEAVRIASARVVMEHAYRVSDDPEILMEGLTDMGRSVVKWFKDLINAIIEFFKKFLKIFTDWSLSLDKFVTENKDALLESEINTTITGYNFTVLSSPAPNMKALDSLIASYNTAIGNLDSIDLVEIRKESAEFLSTGNLEQLRAEVLGAKGGIEADKFLTEVRKFYRDGDESAVTIKVDSSYIRDIVNHADRLVKAKDEAVKDRDRLIALLKASEKFFSTKLNVSYDKGKTNIPTRTISSNSSSDKFESKEGDAHSYESYYKKHTSIMTAKYNEAKALSAIVNVIVTERANAFRDQVKQERKAVAMVMRPIPKKTEESTMLYDDVEEAFDYTAYGNELDFITGPVAENIELRNLCREALWYQSVLEGKYDQVAMESLIGGLANALQGFILKITGMFRGNAKKLSKKYTPWFDDKGVVDAIKANARKTSLQLVDHWSADYRRDLTLIEDAFNRVFQEPSDTNKCIFAAQFLKETDIEKIKGFKDNKRDMVNVLKNYFRCGKAGVDVLDKVTIAGASLEKQIDNMITYVRDFSKFSETLVNLDAKAKNLKVPTEESTSLWFDSHLSIEGCSVVESSLSTILPMRSDFDYVMEATPTNAPAPNPGGNQQANQNATTVAKNANTDEKKTVDATKVVDNSNNDLEKTTVGDQGKGKNSDAQKVYFSFTCDFLKKLVSSYCTVCEERAVLYVNVLKNCAGSENRPVFRNGEYVKKSIRVSDEGRTVEVNATSDETTKKPTLKQKASKLVSSVKNKVSGKKGATTESVDIDTVYEKPTIGLDWMD